MQSTMKNTYGYIWSDWVYHHDKDRFMVDVYNDCKRIDECVDTTEKAALLTLLRDKVQHSKKPWVEGIIDFIDFESSSISSGKVPLDVLKNIEDYQVLAIIDGAYRHGAFRGLCRMASGAEWIGFMGEWCAAALHQGLKWMRNGKKPVSEWELPSLGEAWCKGTAIWSLTCMFMIVDQAGDNPDNDQIIARIHTVIAAHHMAGVNWLEYRGEHPHRWFDSSVRGIAPCQQAIRRFGEKHNYPDIMIDIMCGAAAHVNQWMSPPFEPTHNLRTRGLVMGDSTPRLMARVDKICDELVEVVGDMTVSEVEEFQWRLIIWICTYTVHWRARGDSTDTVLEVCFPGALMGVLRESRLGGVTPELVDRIVHWGAKRIQHLPREQQEIILSVTRNTMEIRGRIPGSLKYSSTGLGHSRFLEGVWILSILLMRTVTPGGSPEFPPSLMPLAIQYFNETKGFKRIEGVDIPPGGDDAYGGCLVCLPRDLFVALVDNRPSTGVLQCTIWGSLLYANLGLGLPHDVSLGCVKNIDGDITTQFAVMCDVGTLEDNKQRSR